MVHSNFTWNAKDGIELFGQSWEPEGVVKAAVCIVHGMGEHSSRYEHVADYLCKHQIGVLTFDHRGHGKSKGKRGHSPSYDTLLDDIEAALSETYATFPEVPIFLYGHSMGGNLALNYALRRSPNIRGVIASSPWLRLAFQPSRVDVFLAKIMVKIFPSFSQKTKLETKAISRDAEVVKTYEADPLVHNKISAAMFLGCYQAGLFALAHAENFKYPLLIYHGTDDRITQYEASKEFGFLVKGDVTWKSFQGFYHESHNEPEKTQVLEMIRNWIREHP